MLSFQEFKRRHIRGLHCSATSGVDFSGFDPNTGGYDTSGFTGPVDTTITGPIVNSGNVVPMPSSAPATNPYSVGGILNGIGGLLQGVASVAGTNKVSPGNVSPMYLRPQGAGALGAPGLGGVSIVPLLLLGAVAYFFLKKKRA